MDGDTVMSRRPARFTEADLRRAIRAVAKTNGRYTVEIAPDGTIRIVPRDERIEKPRKEAVL
jgi:hypothetical protein